MEKTIDKYQAHEKRKNTLAARPFNNILLLFLQSGSGEQIGDERRK
jgi:hypothetical protein